MKLLGDRRRLGFRATSVTGDGNPRGDIGGPEHVADNSDMADLRPTGGPSRDPGSPPLVIATLHRPQGLTGVQTHVHELLQYLERRGRAATLITPFSWGGPLSVPVFGPRLVLSRVSRPAGVMWHRHWHEVFLRKALRRHLAGLDDCIIYAQGPLAARAALCARQGPHQRVVMAIHFRVSQADEYVESQQIKRDGRVFRHIRQVEREVIPRLDGAVSVTKWARDALVAWLPLAAAVPYAIISNFVYRQHADVASEPLGDLVTLGRLGPEKNHGFLLKALAHANRSGRRYSLDIYGEGACRADLAQMAAALGLEGQVRFGGSGATSGRSSRATAPTSTQRIPSPPLSPSWSLWRRDCQSSRGAWIRSPSCVTMGSKRDSSPWRIRPRRPLY